MPSVANAFTTDDFAALSRLVIETWTAGVDRDWSMPAGTLEWSCWKTADHTVDCVFSYAFFLASGRLGTYPPFGELHAFDEATPADLIAGLRAVTTMLWAVVVTADPEMRAVIGQGEDAPPSDFPARGGLEMILHAHDVCAGLGVPFDPPRDLCARLRDHTASWWWVGTTPVSDDAWRDLLVRSGRPS